MLAELVSDLLGEFVDDEGTALVTEAYISRAAERALPLVATDLGVLYELADESVTPSMPGDHRELWVLRAKVFVCRFLRAQASNRISFASGDKSMNRSSEAKNWADLEKDLLAEYAARTSRINPAGDESLLKLELRPLAFSVATLEQQEEVPE
jgi:hypothetical protein